MIRLVELYIQQCSTRNGLLARNDFSCTSHPPPLYLLGFKRNAFLLIIALFGHQWSTSTTPDYATLPNAALSGNGTVAGWV